MLTILVAASAFSAESSNPEIRWVDARTLRLEGKGWSETASYYDRLPAKAHGVVRAPVWNLSRDSAGMLIRFETDAREIHARWALTSANLAMPHMAATGVSGVDLYVREKAGGKWRWLAVGQPKAQTNSVALVKGLPAGHREYLLYLPLYNGLSSLEIGVPAGAVLRSDGVGREERKPVVFYGTSILQGGCASRPGMAHVAILGRRFDWPVINLGFSGNGKMEPEMGGFIAELDAAVFVLDCLPNMTEAEVAKRIEPFVKTLRARYARTPIVLVEDRTYADAFMQQGRHERNEGARRELKAAWQRLKSSGVKQLYYVKGDRLLGDDGEATVDGSHPTDLGFVRQAEVLAKVLKPLLKHQ